MRKRSGFYIFSILILVALLVYPIIAQAAVDDSYSVVLLHMNGSNGSTTFTDESGKTWNHYGSAQISTAQSKFGGASGLFTASSSDYIHTGDSSDLNNLTNTFTIDCWVYLATFPNSSHYAIYAYSKDANDATVLRLNKDSGGNVTINYNDYSSDYLIQDVTNTVTLNATTWYHIAYVYNNKTPYIFLNGVSQTLATSTNGNSGTYTGGSSYIGQDGSSEFYFNGYIDEFRISKGIARWTSNFTPPSSEYAPAETSTPTSTSTNTLTSTPTNTPSPTLTFTPSNTFTPTPLPSTGYCSGGTITHVGSYIVHTFLYSGTLICPGNVYAEILVIGGGGGGGYVDGGGGGAGAFINTYTTIPSGTWSATVGSGGNGSSSASAQGATGNSSSVYNLLAAGGGGGGSGGSSYSNGLSGGSGGGGASTAGYGAYGVGSGSISSGGNGNTNAGGGGGGANANGNNAASTTIGGTGGNGLASSISGSSVNYAGGGGGGPVHVRNARRPVPPSHRSGRR